MTDIILNRSIPNTQFRSDTGVKHITYPFLIKKKKKVKISQYLFSFLFSFSLIFYLMNTPGGLDFINSRLVNFFFNRLTSSM